MRHLGCRGVRPARREERACRAHASDEQRGPAGCIGGQGSNLISTRALRLSHRVDVPRDLVSVLEFINSRKHLGEQVSFKDIGQKFRITAPTTQKRVHELYHLGLLRIVKQGRNKIIELTEKGAEAVSKK